MRHVFDQSSPEYLADKSGRRLSFILTLEMYPRLPLLSLHWAGILKDQVLVFRPPYDRAHLLEDYDFCLLKSEDTVEPDIRRSAKVCISAKPESFPWRGGRWT